ncbi:unnamed protein product [Mesocestoides corti]|uniref:SH3 domain-containing protein n=1 Tax=Mesocestoides corti TaxID=53468 RepID=A0A158QUA6_MESCO|nr:unnamed protein product [Mesocestoides corti]
MMACLQPSNRVRAQMAIKNLGGKSKNQNLYPYEEKHFASFVNKQSEHIGGNLRGALQAMGVTYQQVADLKSTRDSSIKTDVIKPMNEITLKELSNLQKLRKTCSDAQRELTAAEKNRNNVGDQASIERREKALRAHTEANTRLQNAISDFRRDEPKRLLVLQSAAEIQLDYYKKAMEAFQNLVQELSSIQSNATYNVENQPSTLNNFGEYGVSQGGSQMTSDFGFTATVKRNESHDNYSSNAGAKTGRCRALYEFEAETDDDLPLQKGDIVTIIQQYKFMQNDHYFVVVQVDNQWFYGECNGRKGHFPVEYVEVLEPLN